MNALADIKPFKPVPWWGWALAAAGVSLTVSAGFWQLSRAETKREMQARIDDYARQPPLRLTGLAAAELNADAYLLRRVTVSGTYDVTKQVFLDNRVYKGQAGYHVITPLAIANSKRHVLINRGWIASRGERGMLPVVNTPLGGVTVTGTAVEGATRYVELSGQTAKGGEAAAGAIWQNLVLARYRAATGLDVLPFIVQQDAGESKGAGNTGDGLVRDWPPADLRRNTNLAYAVQWFGMALAIALYMIFLHIRYVRSRR